MKNNEQIDVWATIKAFCKDKHNQKKFLQVSIFLTAIILGSVFYFARPDNEMMNGAKYFAAAVCRMDTMQMSSYLSEDTDKETAETLRSLFTNETSSSYYKKASAQSAFMIGDTYIKGEEGWVKIQFTIPNLKLNYESVFPDGVTQWLGETPTIQTLFSTSATPIFQKLSDAIDNNVLTFSKTTLQFPMKKSGESWGVTVSKENLDALSGFLFSSTLGDNF